MQLFILMSGVSLIILLLSLEFSIFSRLDWEGVPGMVLSNSSSGIPGLHHHTQLLCGPVVLNSDSFTCVSGALPVSAIFLFSLLCFLLATYLSLFPSLILNCSLTLICHKIFCVPLCCTLKQVSLHVSPTALTSHTVYFPVSLPVGWTSEASMKFSTYTHKC